MKGGGLCGCFEHTQPYKLRVTPLPDHQQVSRHLRPTMHAADSSHSPMDFKDTLSFKQEAQFQPGRILNRGPSPSMPGLLTSKT